MEQSALVSDKLTFHSALSVDQVRQRINDRAVNSYFGALVEAVGGGPELFGRVRGRRVRLQRPHGKNDAVPVLVGRLDVADDGGTILTAEVRLSFGWPRRPPSNVEDIEYITEALQRIAGLSRTSRG